MEKLYEFALRAMHAVMYRPA